MIPERERITIRPVTNGWSLEMYQLNAEEDDWNIKYEYVFQSSEILLAELKKNILSTKSIDAVHYE